MAFRSGQEGEKMKSNQGFTATCTNWFPLGYSRFVLAILFLCLISSAWAQNITGSGTPNVVPQFTSSSAIGDSPIFTSADGNVGIGGTSPPVQRLEVFDF